MRYILLFLSILLYSFHVNGQDISEVISDSIETPVSVSDSILPRSFETLQAPVSEIDTTRKINYWNITERTGEIIPAHPDTFLTDYFNRTNAEGHGLSVAYLGNLGTPMESRIFFELADRSHFLFEDTYWAYLRTPGKYPFMNTKIPHSNVSYQRAGDILVREERLQTVVATNIGKNLNLGVDLDYLYARGYYQSQSAKHWDWVFFGNYLSDRHRLHLFINPVSYTNAENGGIVNDEDITQPDSPNAVSSSREIQTRLGRGGENTTWNRLKGYRVYGNYHYNLGFDRKTSLIDEE